jgi:hypothetical protein
LHITVTLLSEKKEQNPVLYFHVSTLYVSSGETFSHWFQTCPLRHQIQAAGSWQRKMRVNWRYQQSSPLSRNLP